MPVLDTEEFLGTKNNTAKSVGVVDTADFMSRKPYTPLGPPADINVAPVAPTPEPPGVLGQLGASVLESVDPIARNVFNWLQGTSGTPDAAPPLRELPGFEAPTRTEGGGYFENAPSRVARTVGGIPTAIAEYAAPTIAAAPLGPLAPVAGFAATDAANAALTNRADEAMGREPQQSVAEAAAKGALLGSGFEALKFIPSPMLRAALGWTGLTFGPPAMEGRTPELEDAVAGLLGIMAGKGGRPSEAPPAPVDIPIDLGPRGNTSRSYESQGPKTPQPPDTYKAGETAPLTPSEGQVTPSEPVLAGTTTLGESRRQSPAFESKGTPKGVSVQSTEDFMKSPQEAQRESIDKLGTTNTTPTEIPTKPEVSTEIPAVFKSMPLDVLQEQSDAGVLGAQRELQHRTEVMQRGEGQQETSKNADVRQEAQVLKGQEEPSALPQEPVASGETPLQEAPPVPVSDIQNVNTSTTVPKPQTQRVPERPRKVPWFERDNELFGGAEKDASPDSTTVPEPAAAPTEIPVAANRSEVVGEIQPGSVKRGGSTFTVSVAPGTDTRFVANVYRDGKLIHTEPVNQKSTATEVLQRQAVKATEVVPEEAPAKTKKKKDSVIDSWKTTRDSVETDADVVKFARSAGMFKKGGALNVQENDVSLFHELPLEDKLHRMDAAVMIQEHLNTIDKATKKGPGKADSGIVEDIAAAIDWVKTAGRAHLVHVAQRIGVAIKGSTEALRTAVVNALSGIRTKLMEETGAAGIFDPEEIARRRAEAAKRKDTRPIEERPEHAGLGMRDPLKAYLDKVPDDKIVTKQDLINAGVTEEHLKSVKDNRSDMSLDDYLTTPEPFTAKDLKEINDTDGIKLGQSTRIDYDPLKEIKDRTADDLKAMGLSWSESNGQFVDAPYNMLYDLDYPDWSADPNERPPDTVQISVKEAAYRFDSRGENINALKLNKIADELREAASNNNRVRYEQFTPPGGSKYREHVITLDSTDAQTKQDMSNVEHSALNDPGKLFHMRTTDREVVDIDRANKINKSIEDKAIEAFKNYEPEYFNRYYTPGGSIEIVKEVDGYHATLKDKSGQQWVEIIVPDTESFDISKDANKYKAFNIDELQSDLHQMGQKRGYKGVIQKPKFTPDDIVVTKVDPTSGNRGDWILRDRNAAPDAGPLAVYPINRIYGLTEEAARNTYMKDHKHLFEPTEGTMPNAPFKGEQWAELGIRRAIKMALEEGKDYVTWSAGKDIQAAVGGPDGLVRFYDETMKKITNRIIRGYGGEVVDFVDTTSGETKHGFKIPPKLAEEARTKGMPLRAEHLANPLEHLAVVYDGLKTLAREHLIPLAKKLGVAIKGSTQALRSAVGAEIKRLMTERSGAARIPNRKDLKDFIASVQRITSPRTQTGQRKPRGTFREEKMQENAKGQQSFLQELNDTLVALDEGKMSLDEMVQLGESRLKEAGSTESILRGDHRVIKDVSAATILSRGLVGDLFDLTKKAEGAKISEQEFQAKADKTVEKIHKLAQLPTDAARAVRMQAIAWSPVMMKDIAEKLSNYKNLSKKQKAAIEKMLKATDAESVAEAYNATKDPKLQDYITEYYYNNLLSGAQTLSTNLITTALWTHAQVPLRAFESSYDMLQAIARGMVGQKYTRQRYARESIELLRGMYGSGLTSGLKEAGKAIRGFPTEFDTAIETELVQASEAWANSKHASVRAAAPIVALPSRLMRSADVLLKGLGKGGQEAAVIERWTRNQMKSTGSDYATARAQVESLLNLDTPNGRKLRAELARESNDFAHSATFNDAPNRLVKRILSGRNELGLFGRLIVPFINTTTNMLATSVEMTPGLGLAKEAVAHVPGIGHGKAVTPMGFNNIMAKQTAGAIILMSVAAMFDQDEITAKGPDSPAEREAWLKTHQPYSIKVGGKWYNYTKTLGPMSAPIASYAIWLEEKQNSIRKGEKTALDDPKTLAEFDSLASNTAGYFFDSSWAAQLYASYGYGKGPTDALSRQSARIASGLVPFNGAFRSILGTALEVNTGMEKKDADNFWEYFRAQSPLVESLTTQVPGKLDALGQRLLQQGGVWRFWLPVGVYEPSSDPVEKELARVAEETGFAPAWPSPLVSVDYKESKGKTFEQTDHTMSKELYREYAQAVGKEYNTELSKMFGKAYYQKLSDKQKAEEIGRLHADVSEGVREDMKDKINAEIVSAGKAQIKREHGVQVIRKVEEQ